MSPARPGSARAGAGRPPRPVRRDRQRRLQGSRGAGLGDVDHVVVDGCLESGEAVEDLIIAACGRGTSGEIGTGHGCGCGTLRGGVGLGGHERCRRPGHGVRNGRGDLSRLAEHERRFGLLLVTADLVTFARTVVEYDSHGDVVDVHAL